MCKRLCKTSSTKNGRELRRRLGVSAKQVKWRQIEPYLFGRKNNIRSAVSPIGVISSLVGGLVRCGQSRIPMPLTATAFGQPTRLPARFFLPILVARNETTVV